MEKSGSIITGKSEKELISERVRYLQESTDFISAIFNEMVGYAITVADFDGNIIAYNKGGSQIYGYTSEEVIGKKKFDIFFPKDFIESEKLQKLINDLLRKERFFYEGERIRKNGKRFPAQVLMTLTKDRSGKLVGIIEIVQDLTERVEREREREGERERERERRLMAERIKQLEREMNSLEHIAISSQTAFTAEAFGIKPLKEHVPDIFKELTLTYGGLMELAFEQRIHKVEHNISGKLNAMGERLGFLKAGPRDVVDIYTSTLKGKTEDAPDAKAQAYAEEGRMMVLELMGHLVSYYRKYSMGVRRE